MDDDNKINYPSNSKSRKKFDYDKYIVTTNSDDSDSSLSSIPMNMIGLDLENEKEDLQNTEKPQDSGTFGLKECFVLTLGILERVNTYFNNNAQRGEEERTFKEHVSLVMNILIASKEHFGYKVVTEIDGLLHIGEGDPEQEGTVTNVRKQPVQKPKKLQKHQVKAHGKKLNNTTSNTSKTPLNENRGKKRNRVQSEPRCQYYRTCKYSKMSTGDSYDLTLLQVAAKTRSALTGRDVHTVFNELKESLRDSQKKNNRKGRSPKKNVLSKSVSNKTPEVNKTIQSLHSASTTDILKGRIRTKESLEKRKLYSPTVWLEKISKK